MQATASDVRFLRFFGRPEEGCWQWRGGASGTKSTYGYFNTEGRTLLAHRYAYTLWVGEIPGGWEIHHRCRNPLCVRPDHLEAVTSQRNSELERTLVCTEGHDLTNPENCVWDKKGRRRGCIICHREKARKRMALRYAMKRG